MFGLIDCNNFYASCERVFRPDLNGKPVVVLSNNDGCIIARSNEVKDLGIPMGAPFFKYKSILEANHVAVFSANFALYGDLSMRVMNILASYCPEIEIYSVDEAFLDFTSFKNFDLQNYGEEIFKKVKKSTGIPISVGFAPTKSLAKVANRIAKKYPKETKGVYIINTEEKRLKALKWLKIEDIWGIGRRLSKRLKELNIHTALEFTQLPDDYILKNMSVVELRLKQELEGHRRLELEDYQPKKNIATTRTFEHGYSELADLKERITTFSVVCAEKLRKQKSCCHSVMVFLRTDYHRKEMPQHNQSIVITIPFGTNSSIEIAEYAVKGLETIYSKGHVYKKAGVVIMDFCPENAVQPMLFDNANPKHKALMQVVDSINKNIGDYKVKLAAQDLNKTWKMKQEKLSRRFTTRLNEVMEIGNV